MTSYGSLVFVDTHVHIHDCFPLPAFFESARKNFAAVAHAQGVAERYEGVLMLTETANAKWFERLVSFARDEQTQGRELLGEWEVETTREPASVILSAGAGKRLIVVAGRQIVTAENLEVLALGTEQRFEDGQPIKTVLSLVSASGAIAVIPWGFGKWWGRRGAVMAEIMKAQHELGFCLGDNSGRAGFMPVPAQFKEAQAKGMPILPGSDPLPFASEFWRPGSVGLMFQARLSALTPAADLKRLLHSPTGTAKRYGRLEGPIRFIRNQCAMQLAKLIY